MKLPWIKATAFVEVALSALQPDAESKQAKEKRRSFVVKHAEISRMEIDPEGNVSFKCATLAVLRLLMPNEELMGVLKLPDVANQEEAYLENKSNISAQVAALALQEAFKRRKAAREKSAQMRAPAGNPGMSSTGGSTETMVGAMSTPGTMSPERDESGAGAPPLSKPKEVPEVDALPPRDLPPGVLSPDKLRELEEKRGEPDAAG